MPTRPVAAVVVVAVVETVGEVTVEVRDYDVDTYDHARSLGDPHLRLQLDGGRRRGTAASPDVHEIRLRESADVLVANADEDPATWAVRTLRAYPGCRVVAATTATDCLVVVRYAQPLLVAVPSPVPTSVAASLVYAWHFHSQEHPSTRRRPRPLAGLLAQPVSLRYDGGVFPVGVIPRPSL